MLVQLEGFSQQWTTHHVQQLQLLHMQDLLLEWGIYSKQSMSSNSPSPKNQPNCVSFFLSRATTVVGKEDTGTKLEGEIVQNGCSVFSLFRATAEASSWLF